VLLYEVPVFRYGASGEPFELNSSVDSLQSCFFLDKAGRAVITESGKWPHIRTLSSAPATRTDRMYECAPLGPFDPFLGSDSEHIGPNPVGVPWCDCEGAQRSGVKVPVRPRSTGL